MDRRQFIQRLKKLNVSRKETVALCRFSFHASVVLSLLLTDSEVTDSHNTLSFSVVINDSAE